MSEYDFEIVGDEAPYRGDSALIELSLTRLSDEDILDLTPATAITFSMRETEDGLLLLTKDLDDGVTIKDPDGGVIDVEFEPGDTDDMAGFFVCDVESIVAGQKYTVKGILEIKKDVTHEEYSS